MRWRAGVVTMSLAGCYVMGYLIVREVHNCLIRGVKL